MAEAGPGTWDVQAQPTAARSHPHSEGTLHGATWRLHTLPADTVQAQEETLPGSTWPIILHGQARSPTAARPDRSRPPIPRLCARRALPCLAFCQQGLCKFRLLVCILQGQGLSALTALLCGMSRAGWQVWAQELPGQHCTLQDSTGARDQRRPPGCRCTVEQASKDGKVAAVPGGGPVMDSEETAGYPEKPSCPQAQNGLKHTQCQPEKQQTAWLCF